MTAVLFLLLAAAPLEHKPADTKSRWMIEGEAALFAQAKALQTKPLHDRLLEISKGFLDTPYIHSPLGEGEGAAPDPDPTFRVDAVDCLTFVEETIALAVARKDGELEQVLEAIRYETTKSYAERNHLMEAQWIPNNIKKGFLRDVTSLYGGADAVAAEKLLTERTWSSKSSQELQLPKDKQLKGAFKFKLVPLERALEIAKKVPPGTLMMVVRDDLPLKATRITHLGFLHQSRKGRPQLRHAARNNYGRVIDEDLETFLGRNSKYEKWKVSGVSFYEVREPKVIPPPLAKTTP